MFVVLPLLALVILFATLFQRCGNWRSSILCTALIWGVIITITTEVLSLFRLLEFGWLSGIWIVINIVLVVTYFRFAGKRKLPLPKMTAAKLPETEPITPILLGLLGGVAVVLAIVGITALIAPPNTWDSMAYHMARVMHWLQNRSLAHYPTVFLPQLYQCPWAEMAIAQFQLLSGGDRFANLVQWFSMAGSLLGTSLIAQQLGANLRGQIFSVVVAVTIPMGILQGSSTQNDYVAAFWLVSLAYYVLLSIQQQRIFAAEIGASVGLAILTKGTAYIYAFPFLIWLLWSLGKQLSWKIWKPAATIALIFLLLNLGHYWRNIDLFGNPLGTGAGEETYTNETFSLLIFLSNIVRNVSLHLGTPIDTLNRIIEQSITFLHTIVGLDVNDPQTTAWGDFRIHGLSRWEDNAGNPLHLFLILSTLVLCFTRKSLRRHRYLLAYLLVVTSTFLLFCLLLKWQPWHSRLQLPIFMLFSAAIGVVLSRSVSYKVANSVAVALLVSAFLWVFFNETRPLIVKTRVLNETGNIVNIFNTSRTQQYFNYRTGSHVLLEPYLGAVDFVKSRGCTEVGLSLPYDPWEYPLWVMMQQNQQQPLHLKHVDVNNVSAVKQASAQYNNFEPCAIISVGDHITPTTPREVISTEQGEYTQIWSLDLVNVLTKPPNT